jgi:hypothetical protein
MKMESYVRREHYGALRSACVTLTAYNKEYFIWQKSVF